MTDSVFLPRQAVSSVDFCNAFLEQCEHAFPLGAC